MIYKFIDVNGNEITVNSLSSLQGLVDSDTIKKDTKVKAGLRGNWTTAENIPELVFNENIAEEETSEDIAEPEEDIRSFITKDAIEKQTEEAPKQDHLEQKQEIEKVSETIKKEVVDEIIETEEEDNSTKEKKLDTSDYYTEKHVENRDSKKNTKIKGKKGDKNYDDENVIGLNFFDSIGTCLKKYFNFKDRASRSEYWYFQLLISPIVIWSQFPSFNDQIFIIQLILTFGMFIPTIAVTVRRLHDRDKSGWLFLITFIPLVGTIILLIILIEKGTEGKNRFGDYPLKLKKY